MTTALFRYARSLVAGTDSASVRVPALHSFACVRASQPRNRGTTSSEHEEEEPIVSNPRTTFRGLIGRLLIPQPIPTRNSMTEYITPPPSPPAPGGAGMIS